MGLFKTRSHLKEKEKLTKHVDSRDLVVLKSASGVVPLNTNPASDSDTEPPTSDSDSSNHRKSISDEDKSGSDEAEQRKSRRKKKIRNRAKCATKPRGYANDQTITPETQGNPFANKGETQLGSDMIVLAEALTLDLNTQTMLAYYDARSLEDFCLMAEADFKDLLAKARSMNRALPPLQIRKVQVLREWVQELSKPRDDSTLPAWVRLSQPKTSNKKGSLIPKDWKMRLKKDLPQLKMKLKVKGERLTSYPWINYLLSFRSIVLCGF
jgi:hypothetical protein